MPCSKYPASIVSSYRSIRSTGGGATAFPPRSKTIDRGDRSLARHRGARNHVHLAASLQRFLRDVVEHVGVLGVPLAVAGFDCPRLPIQNPPDRFFLRHEDALDAARHGGHGDLLEPIGRKPGLRPPPAPRPTPNTASVECPARPRPNPQAA